MGLDRGRKEPVADTGRMGYRQEWEPEDERRALAPYRCQCLGRRPPAVGCRGNHGFWRDESERLTYESAVEDNPRREGEGPMAYAARISAIVAGKYSKLGGMPSSRLTRRQRDERLARLRGQAQGLPSGTEDYTDEEVII
jgi:hypothetical protein